MNRCQDTALLEEYLDGALAQQQSAQVEAHLAVCPECRAYVQEWLALRASFPGPEDTPPPEGFARRVAEAAARYPRRRRHWRQLAAAAACLALMALLWQGLGEKRAAMGGDGAAVLYSTGGAAAPSAAAPNAAASSGGEEAAQEAVPQERVQAADNALPPQLSKGQTAAAEVLTLSGPELTETVAALLSEHTPLRQSPGSVCYRLERSEAQALFEALEQAQIALPDIPEAGAVFELEVYDE